MIIPQPTHRIPMPKPKVEEYKQSNLVNKDINISIDINYKILINDKEMSNLSELKNVPDLSKVSDKEEAKRLFQIFLDSNWDYIQSSIPQGYVISKNNI